MEDDGRAAFGRRVDSLLGEQNHTRSWLGAEVARIEGDDEPISGASVSKWVAGNPPRPERVFAIEEALGVKPGALSKLLGYLPITARRPCRVPDAIAEDADLTQRDQQLLASLYAQMVRDRQQHKGQRSA